MIRVSRGSIMPSSETRAVAKRPLEHASAQNSNTPPAWRPPPRRTPGRAVWRPRGRRWTSRPAICLGPMTAILAVGQMKVNREPNARPLMP